MKIYIKAAIMDISDEPFEVIMEMASDPSGSPEVMEQIFQYVCNLLSDDSIPWRFSNARDLLNALAKNPNTPSEILESIVKTNFPQIPKSEMGLILCGIASNLNTPIDILAELANSNNKFIKSHIAENPNTPISILQKLANDDSEDVRVGVLWSKHLTPELAMQFIDDPSSGIREELASIEDNRLSVETIHKILESLYDDPIRSVRSFVAANSKCPAEILHKLASDAHYSVRLYVAYNKNTADDDLISLSADSNSAVVKHAKMQLQERGIMK